MDRKFYLDLAAREKPMPVATHLVLHEKDDPEGILLDGERMAAVMAETARRFDSPLALPVMDLILEKDFMLKAIGVPADKTGTYHFDEPPSAEQIAAIETADVLAYPRFAANCASLRRLATDSAAAGGPGKGGLVPVGMTIGPFSLLTKLLADPIVALYMAGAGMTAEDSDEVALVTSLLPLCESVVRRSVAAQVTAGAKAMFVCEPAANLVFFSPNQLEEGSSVFDDFVIAPNMRLKADLDSAGADLIFHDCGSLTHGMVQAFRPLHPVIFSFGSPVDLGEIEPFVAKDTVIYGNLPTKKFYSDEEVPLDAIPGMVGAIESRLKAAGHPYIIGSECDVLSMPGYEKKIMEKVVRFCGCGAHGH